MTLDLFSQDIFEKKELEASQRPLAERMRPQSLAEVVGQTHLIGENKPLSVLAETGLASIILWGPPGTGKTTIARLLARDRLFQQISAVLSGVQDLRNIVERFRYKNKGAVVFVDEIHRWNKAQQDALLPYVEDGTIVLIGATTENPSFSLIGPLLSRTKVFVLRPLEESDITTILKLALADKQRSGLDCEIEDDALQLLVSLASGDARQALTLLELVAKFSKRITRQLALQILERRTLHHDKKGELHYDTISAFIKSMRGSDPDAAIYYLAKMYESGEDPRFLARRMIIFASEDIGNADPRALQIALSAAEAFDRVGEAEGWIPLAHAVTYLATAPKSNASYMAYKNAKAAIEQFGDLPVPMHLRNAPTKLMKDLGYGENYQYAHDQPDAVVTQTHLPEALASQIFYHPTSHGFDKNIRERLEWLRKQKEKQL